MYHCYQCVAGCQHRMFDLCMIHSGRQEEIDCQDTCKCQHVLSNECHIIQERLYMNMFQMSGFMYQ